MLNLGTYTYPHSPPDQGEAMLVAEFHCDAFTPGGDHSCHEASGVMSIKLVAGREVEQWLPGGGDYTYVERTVPLARLWEANVKLWLPWGCCDDWKIEDAFHNPLGLSEKDAHDLVQTTGICELLAELIAKKEKAHA